MNAHENEKENLGVDSEEVKDDKLKDQNAGEKEGRISFVFKCILSACTVLVVAASALFCTSIGWMFRTWKYLSINELLYQLQTSAKGTNRDMIEQYLAQCLPVTIIALGAAVVALIIIRKQRKIYFIVLGGVLVVSVLSVGSFTAYAWNRLDVSDYIKNRNTDSDFFDENYVSPAEVSLQFPAEKRNLIYIFLESMEVTYSDKENGGIFEDNYIPELTKLAQENEDFSGGDTTLNGGKSLVNTSWTASALFAQTSGLPLTVPLESDSQGSEEKMLPGVVSLGDILDSEGYNQVFMIGTDGEFGGRTPYFTAHGNYNVEDYYYFVDNGKIEEGRWVWWGLEDCLLFDFAKEKILELSQKDEPFNFTMLTVDTHFEDGYLCEKCGTKYGDNQYANVISCSDSQILEFVNWIKSQEFYENTTIVISGDHPTMDSDFCDSALETYDRKVYSTYINSAVSPANKDLKREYSTFDNFPTTLSSLGVIIEGERLGLGTNLFSNVPTLLEMYGEDTINIELSRDSELLKKLMNQKDETSLTTETVQENVPTAVVQAYPYDFRSGIFKVSIDQFANIEKLEEIANINVAVWTQEERGDQLWIQAFCDENNTYWADIFVPDFQYKTGDYYIEAYLINTKGEQVVVGNTTIYIE